MARKAAADLRAAKWVENVKKYDSRDANTSRGQDRLDDLPKDQYLQSIQKAIRDMAAIKASQKLISSQEIEYHDWEWEEILEGDTIEEFVVVELTAEKSQQCRENRQKY